MNAAKMLLMVLLLLPACSQKEPSIASLSPSSGGESAESASGEHKEAGGEGHASEENKTTEEGGHTTAKKKAPEGKSKSDSVISSVMALPVVKKWADWMESKGTGSHLIAYGEYVTEVHGHECWSIAVAEENSNGNITNWKRFCMEMKGLEMWVESALGSQSDTGPNYITYERWMSSCRPSYNSAGDC